MTEYKTFVIRLKVKKGSDEECLLEFLNNEQVRPFSKPQMVLLALKTFWLTLSLLYEGKPVEQILASVNQSVYLWKLQEQYLCKVVGVEPQNFASGESQLKKSSATSVFQPVPVEQPDFSPFGDIVSIK